MNKKSKEIVKKLCFTLVVVISIISIIGCPNTVSSKANGTDNKEPLPQQGNSSDPGSVNPDNWSGLDADQVIQKMEITEKSDIVTDLCGLGFGMIGDKLCLSYGKVGKGTSKLLSDAKQDIEEEIGVWDDYPAEDSYSNITDGLEKRWFAARETIDTKGGTVKWLEDVTVYNNLLAPKYFPYEKVKVTYGRDITINSLAFAVDTNEGKLFALSGASGGGYKLFADWHIVFVKKANSKVYSFHYGPYTLKGNFDENNPKISVNYDDDVHIFTLSGMLKDYLTQKRSVSPSIADQLVTTYSLNDTSKYDVYLVLGKISCTGSSTPFTCYRFVHRSFRNVLKLTDSGFWSGCWNQ